MNWKFENFKKGPLSTIVGALLMSAAVYVYLVVPSSELFAMALLAAGGYAFGIKDPKIPGNTPMILVAALLLGGCVTYNKCLDKFGTLTKDSTRVGFEKKLNVGVDVPGDSLEGAINLDTLCAEWQALSTQVNDLTSADDSLKQSATGGLLTTALWIDKYNRLLRFKSKVRDSIIYKEVLVRDSVNCPPPVVIAPPTNKSRLEWLWEQFQFFAAWIVLGGLFFMGVKRVFKR